LSSSAEPDPHSMRERMKRIRPFYESVKTWKEDFIMPRGDATGPTGMGSMTGRAAGFCAGYNMPGYLNKGGGRGCGMGFGRRNNIGGFGRRNRFFAGGLSGGAWSNHDPDAEKQALQSQVEFLQTKMDAIRKRLDELTAKE